MSTPSISTGKKTEEEWRQRLKQQNDRMEQLVKTHENLRQILAYQLAVLNDERFQTQKQLYTLSSSSNISTS